MCLLTVKFVCTKGFEIIQFKPLTLLKPVDWSSVVYPTSLGSTAWFEVSISSMIFMLLCIVYCVYVIVLNSV